MEYVVRKANKEELEELKRFLMSERGLEEETAEQFANDYFYMVLEGFISESPGYVGKVMVCLYASPEFRDVYIWQNGEITLCEGDDE